MNTTYADVQFKDEEFECPLCLKLLAEPVSVPCSHNFCKLCLQRTLQEHKPQCPVCRSNLSFLNPEDLRPNLIIQSVMQNIFKDRYDERLKEAEEERKEIEAIIRVV